MQAYRGAEWSDLVGLCVSVSMCARVSFVPSPNMFRLTLHVLCLFNLINFLLGLGAGLAMT